MVQNWIREKRKAIGVSQYKMAKYLGVTFQELSSWEIEKDFPSDSQRDAINNFFENFSTIVANGSIKLRKQISQRSYRLSGQKNKRKNHYELEDGTPAPIFTSQQDGERKEKAITLFSGIGGMSLGLVRAGYQVVGHVEIDDSARKIYKANFPDSECLGTDVRAVSDDALRDWKNKFGEISVIAGGPPCQGFSLAGKRDVLDPRNELYGDFVRIANILKPKSIILENVRMFLSMTSKYGGLIKDDLIKRFDDAGYRLAYAPVNAKNYGVPQSRERVIFIGIRKDLLGSKDISLPLPTHADADEGQLWFASKPRPINTFRDAVRGLEPLESGEASQTDHWHFAIEHPDHVINMLRDVPEGKSAHDNPNPKLRPTSGYNTTYKRLCWNEPSSTISTNFSMISGSRNVHPKNTRSLTIREAMRCQTFPDNFLLCGSLGDIRKGIGNAVPPLLAEVMALHIKNYLANSSKS
jgi:DNA (cytosine-5)-methyltransferase 1